MIYRRHDDRAHHQDPVRPRNVHLPVELGGRMNDLDMRGIGKLHELRQQLESARDHGLRGHDSGQD